MSHQNTVIRMLLAVYIAGSAAVAIPLVLNLAGDLSNSTSGKVLAAAVIALGLGAALAFRDPWANRTVILVLIVFTSLATLAIVYRLLFEPQHEPDPARYLLPIALAAPILLAVFYPRAPDT
jgi:hypothetical protein